MVFKRLVNGFRHDRHIDSGGVSCFATAWFYIGLTWIDKLLDVACMCMYRELLLLYAECVHVCAKSCIKVQVCM